MGNKKEGSIDDFFNALVSKMAKKAGKSIADTELQALGVLAHINGQVCFLGRTQDYEAHLNDELMVLGQLCGEVGKITFWGYFCLPLFYRDRWARSALLKIARQRHDSLRSHTRPIGRVS